MSEIILAPDLVNGRLLFKVGSTTVAYADQKGWHSEAPGAPTPQYPPLQSIELVYRKHASYWEIRFDGVAKAWIDGNG